MDIGDIIRNRRLELDLTLEEIGNAVGVGKSTVQKWENGFISNMKRDKIASLAQILQISPVTLITGELDTSYNLKNTEDTTSIPIVGEVAAGVGCYADNNIIGYMDIPDSWITSPEEHVLLKVSGDSMLPEFMEDDLVLIRCQTSVDSGSYAVALIDDENGVIKRVRYGLDWIELQSLNPVYAPRLFEGQDVMRVRIFGLVRKIIRSYD